MRSEIRSWRDHPCSTTGHCQGAKGTAGVVKAPVASPGGSPAQQHDGNLTSGPGLHLHDLRREFPAAHHQADFREQQFGAVRAMHHQRRGPALHPLVIVGIAAQDIGPLRRRDALLAVLRRHRRHAHAAQQRHGDNPHPAQRAQQQLQSHDKLQPRPEEGASVRRSQRRVPAPRSPPRIDSRRAPMQTVPPGWRRTGLCRSGFQVISFAASRAARTDPVDQSEQGQSASDGS